MDFYLQRCAIQGLAPLIEKAVNRALIERTLEGGSEELPAIARRQFLRLAKDASREGHAAARGVDRVLEPPGDARLAQLGL